MANEFFGNRVAYGTFSLPAMVAGSTASTLSARLDGLYIPSGAIVTRVGVLATALTEIASMKDATMNISVSNVALLSNNVKASVVLSANVAAYGTLGATGGVYVPAGGVPVLHIASSDASRSGVSGNFVAHIGYIL